MNTQTIVLGVVVILLLYLVYVYFVASSGQTTLVNYHDATQQTSISASSLPAGATANYTFSIWFYINEWNYRYGEKKVIFQRNDVNNDPAPSVYLDPTTNNLHVSLATYNTSDKSSSTNVSVCSIDNVPIQAWSNLIITLNNRALDMYLNGKLVRTCVMPGVPRMNPSSAVVLCPNGGFSGYISNFKYIANAINPTEAYNIYKDGYSSGSALGNLFDKYRVKIAFVENNKELNSFEL